MNMDMIKNAFSYFNIERTLRTIMLLVWGWAFLQSDLPLSGLISMEGLPWLISLAVMVWLIPAIVGFILGTFNGLGIALGAVGILYIMDRPKQFISSAFQTLYRFAPELSNLPGFSEAESAAGEGAGLLQAAIVIAVLCIVGISLVRIGMSVMRWINKVRAEKKPEAAAAQSREEVADAGDSL